MRVQSCAYDGLLAIGVNNGQCSIAMANEDAPGLRVDANVVSIAAKFDSSGGRKISSLEKPHRSVAGIRDVQRIRRRIVAHPLRFSEVADEAVEALGFHVDHGKAAMTERRNEQTLPGQIDRHVIDPAADIAQRDLRFQLKRRRFRAFTGSAASDEDRRNARQ
jgi:hypothetical protein